MRPKATQVIAVCAYAWFTVIATAANPAMTDATIRQLVQDWAAAWRSGKFEQYAAYYSPEIKEKYASHEAWRTQRRSRIAGRNDIHIDLGPVLVKLNRDDPDVARAIFLQMYRSSSWCDVVEKTLSLRRSELGWRIVGEQARLQRRC